MIKKLTTLLLAITVSAFIFTTPAYALTNTVAVNVLNGPNGPCQGSNQPAVCADNSTNGSDPLFGPGGLITVGVRILSYIVGAVAVFVIIFQGIRIATSMGDSQGVASARNGIIYALVGVAVAASAQAIIAFVLDKI